MGRNIKQVAWRSGRDTVGAVLIDSGADGYKAYIGISLDTEPNIDAEYIAAWGAKLDFIEAVGFFPELMSRVTDKYDGREIYNHMESLVNQINGHLQTHRGSIEQYRKRHREIDEQRVV